MNSTTAYTDMGMSRFTCVPYGCTVLKFSCFFSPAFLSLCVIIHTVGRSLYDRNGSSVYDRNGSMETAHSSSPDASNHDGSGGSGMGGGGNVPGIQVANPDSVGSGGSGFDINDFFKFADTMAVSVSKVSQRPQ